MIVHIKENPMFYLDSACATFLWNTEWLRMEREANGETLKDKYNPHDTGELPEYNRDSMTLAGP